MFLSSAHVAHDHPAKFHTQHDKMISRDFAVINAIAHRFRLIFSRKTLG